MTNVKWGILAAAAVVAFVAGLWLSSGLTKIDKGQIGVVSVFGRVEESTLAPGLHLVSPWKRTEKVNLQVQKNEEEASVPTKGGLPVKLKAVLLYRVRGDGVFQLATGDVGLHDYETRIVEPKFKNAVRDGCGNFDPESLYNSDRTVVEAKVREIAQKELHPLGFEVDSVMLQDPDLPAVVKERIQAKIGAEQDVLRMASVLKQKQLEADAKVVEAEGIAKAQKIIQKDLSREYLIYQWIEAFKEHAKHGGVTVYLPTGNDGLPNFNLPIQKN